MADRAELRDNEMQRNWWNGRNWRNWLIATWSCRFADDTEVSLICGDENENGDRRNLSRRKGPLPPILPS